MPTLTLSSGTTALPSNGKLLTGMRECGASAAVVTLTDAAGEVLGAVAVEPAEAKPVRGHFGDPPAATSTEPRSSPRSGSRTIGRGTSRRFCMPRGGKRGSSVEAAWSRLRPRPTPTTRRSLSLNSILCRAARERSPARSTSPYFARSNAATPRSARPSRPAWPRRRSRSWSGGSKGSFFEGAWARAIRERTMTRQQYIACLYNMHHYVRQTTRHCGRAVGASKDKELRAHWVEHLNGEINHEVSIELDLKTLGVDPSFVMDERVPTGPTKLFMSVQESAIGFYRDPVAFLGLPARRRRDHRAPQAGVPRGALRLHRNVGGRAAAQGGSLPHLAHPHRRR